VRLPQHRIQHGIVRKDERQMHGAVEDDRMRAADNMPQPTIGSTSISPYIASSDAVAARRSARDIVAGNGGGGLMRRFTKRTTTRMRMAIPSGRWIDTSAW